MSQHIEQLQMIEQNLSLLINQKQQYQKQVMEIENALKEIKGEKEAYHIVGPLMIKKKVEEIQKQLEEQKESSTIRITTLDKQEKTLRSQAQEIQEQLVKELNKKQGEKK